MRTTMELVTRSREETEALGERIGRAVRGGELVALWGELGAGKTVVARGIARGLDIDAGEVTSPTFVTMHEHLDGRLNFFHIDLYRIAPDDARSTGWEEALSSGGVTAIEWPDRVERDLPPDRLDLRIQHGGDDERRIRIEPTGPTARALLERAAL